MKKNFKNSKSTKSQGRKGRGKINRDSEAKENMSKEAYGNDISWYVNNPQMLVDACNLSYANVLSQPIPFNPSVVGNTDYSTELDCPGVMAIRVIPTIGSVLRDESKYTSGDMWDSAVNMAARAEWSFIRQKNAGAKNYDAPDLMMYHLAMDNVYMYWSWMVRVYGYLRLYSFKNKYYPNGILRAMGLNDTAINDLRGKMADFRTYINLYAAQMSSFAVPINLPYVKRHLWLFQNTFTDASTTKAQVYLYNPEFLYKLDEVSEEPMRLLCQHMPWNDGGNYISPQLSRIKLVGDSLIAPILKSESCNIMSGDILKAYEAGGIYGFQSIPDDFSLTPVYDETVLSQIHNANFVVPNATLDPEDSFIGQDPNVDAGYVFQVLPCGAASPNAVVIDSRFETPTPTDSMYATRLTNVADPDNDNYISCGSELAVGFTVWTNATNEANIISYGSNQLSDVPIYTINFRGRTGTGYDSNPVEYVSLDSVQDFQKFVSVLSKFDWHPMIPMRSRLQDSGNADNVVSDIFGDVDNFAIVQKQTIAKMHKVALNSEFGLPYTLTSIK